MQAQQQTLPYQNPLLPAETRAEDLLSRMTLEEKIAQIRHLHSWDVFDGQQLNKQKLEKFCSGIGFGFFEGFPLTEPIVRKHSERYKPIWLKRLAWVFLDFL